jgi:hypothetical protein
MKHIILGLAFLTAAVPTSYQTTKLDSNRIGIRCTGVNKMSASKVADMLIITCSDAAPTEK